MRKFYLLYVVMCSYKNKKRIHSTLKVSSDTFGWFSFFSFLISLLSYQWNEIMKDFSIGEFSLYGLHQTPRDTFLLYRMFQCVTQYFISCKRQIKLTMTVSKCHQFNSPWFFGAAMFVPAAITCTFLIVVAAITTAAVLVTLTISAVVVPIAAAALSWTATRRNGKSN